MSKEKYQPGHRFNYLTILEKATKFYGGRTNYGYKCICDCGNIKDFTETGSLFSGKVKSCGCIAKKEQQDRYDIFDLDYYNKIIKIYSDLHNDSQARVRKINGNDSVKNVFKEVKKQYINF